MLDSSATALRPLVISLEGGLIRTSSRDEALLDMLRTDPVRMLTAIAGAAPLETKPTLDNVAHWPLRQDVVDYARRHAQAGGEVALLAAADQAIADAIKPRLDFPVTVTVIAAQRPADTADMLAARFPDGFGHVGTGTETDREIWRRGAACVLAGATEATVQALSGATKPVAVMPARTLDFYVLRRSLRLHQWAKNALIFVPLVLGGKAGDPGAWFAALLGFIALGCVASATYIVNDLWDLPSDRQHWSKHKRPIASGELPIRTALQMAGGLLAGGLLIAALLSWTAVAAVIVYVAVTLAYSFALKRVPLLDVLTLAGLFTLRLGIGVVLTDVRLSPWLLVFSMFTFASLSLAKRHIEVSRMVQHGKTQMSGRGWVAGDGPIVLGLGLATAMGGVLILIMYLIEDAFPKQFYLRPWLLWSFPPLLFLFLGRIWLLCQRDQLSDDPVAFALKDRTCLAIGALGGLAFLAAIV